jgi:hypothetical protein
MKYIVNVEFYHCDDSPCKFRNLFIFSDEQLAIDKVNLLNSEFDEVANSLSRLTNLMYPISNFEDEGVYLRNTPTFSYQAVEEGN